ncbi:hypothetical protein R4Y45_01355 [Holzapfeliella sp. He02]|uniref:Uncharacterized protein n=1 Tax=Holzapfeliella saturejae TaxID=3082953 RepID=A0ABU8SEQ7_9LACO
MFELKQKQLLKIKIISIIETISLIIGYLTLMDCVHTFINTPLLIILTVYLNRIIKNYSQNIIKNLSIYITHLGFLIPILITNVLIGGISANNLVHANSHLGVSYNLGLVLGLTVVCLEVTYGVTTLYKVAVILFKEKTPNISKKGSRINNKLNN